MDNTLRVVITGGPGTGKSTILTELENLGFPIHREVSRAVIKEELNRNSDLLPWRNLPAFSEKVFKGQTGQWHEAEAGKTNFYDRGIIDVIAYLKKDLLPHDALAELVHHYPYHQSVFLTPPWPEIYAQDTERREDLRTMQAIHDALFNTYREFDYKVFEVPKTGPRERMNFVLDHLGLQ